MPVTNMSLDPKDDIRYQNFLKYQNGEQMPLATGNPSTMLGKKKVPQDYINNYNTQQFSASKNNAGKFVQSPPLSPNIAYALDQLLGSGFTGLQNASQQGGFGQNQIQNLFNKTASGLGNYAGFQPIEDRARQQFETKTVPGLAERFTSLGGQSKQGSSAFQGALGSAASDLESQLASLRGQYGLKENALQQNLFGQLLGGGQQNQAQGLQLLQNMLTQGLQPRHEYGFQPAPPSFLSQFGSGLGQGTALAGGLLLKYLTGGAV
jgi:hypothetical protein